MLIGVGEHIWWNTTQFIGVHSVNFTETTPNFCVIQTTWVQNPYFDLNFLGIWTLQNYPRLKSLAWEPMTWDEYYFIDFKLIKVNYSRGSDRPDLEYRFGLLNGRSVAQKIEFIRKICATDRKVTGNLESDILHRISADARFNLYRYSHICWRSI